jgi:hypothetical protein
MTIRYTKNDDGNFVCPHCGVIKERQNSMHYHIKKHLDELNHICKTCNKAFLQKQTLELHIRSKHPELLKSDSDDDQKQYHCPFENCIFTALTKGNCIIHSLRSHFQDEIKKMMILKNETKSIICNKCDKEFFSSSAFYYHCKVCLPLSDDHPKLQTLKSI